MFANVIECLLLELEEAPNVNPRYNVVPTPPMLAKNSLYDIRI